MERFLNFFIFSFVVVVLNAKVLWDSDQWKDKDYQGGTAGDKKEWQE